MSDFNFEYTDTKFTVRLFAISIISFFALLFAMVVTVDFLGIIGSLILAFGVPFLIFYLNRKKIKKHGTANISDSLAEFKLAGFTEKIEFGQIKTYQVERYNGTILIIKLKNGKRFKLQANSNFCNADQFDTICQEFERTIQQFKTTTNAELTRKKSMFEQAWVLPFLILVTGGLIGGIIFAIVKGKNIPPTFYGSIGVVIPMWVSYLTARRKKQSQV